VIVGNATPKGALALLATLSPGSARGSRAPFGASPSGIHPTRLSQRVLSAGSQALLLKLMTESIPGAKRLKGELPAGTVVAHKTGTGGTQNGITSATNDIGIITLPDGRHLAVAAFVSDSAADDDTRDAIIARLTKAAWDQAQSLGR
jgi:beta-lactamase class A